MPLRVTPRRLAAAMLYDPAPATVHVADMHRNHILHAYRLSDHAFGMLWYGLVESSITQTDVCDFHMAFLSNLRIRPGRVHEGRAFLGPDGLAVVIRNEAYNGGDVTVAASPLSGAAILIHPNYQAWVSALLFRSGAREDSDYHRRIIAGHLVAAPAAAVTAPAPTPTPAPAVTPIAASALAPAPTATALATAPIRRFGGETGRRRGGWIGWVPGMWSTFMRWGRLSGLWVLSNEPVAENGERLQSGSLMPVGDV